MATQTTYAAVSGRGSGPTSWPPPPRAALPPFPSPTPDQPAPPQAGCWTHDPFDTTLPFTPPSTPTIDFHRGNVCGHRVGDGGLPYVPGCTEADTSLLFTWFLYLYDQLYPGQGLIDRALDSYQACGYTHINFHRADWLGVVEGVPGCSQEDACHLVRRCADRGLIVGVNLAAYAKTDPDPADILPWADALQAAGMSIAVLGWQIDQLLTYPQVADYINWAGPALQAKGLRTACQWVDGACAVWPFPQYGIYNRFDFQTWAADKIHYQYQQFNTESPLLDIRPEAGGILGEAVDMLESLGGAYPILTLCEYAYKSQFDNPSQILESYSDLKGRSLLAAQWNGRYVRGGYFGGARQGVGDPHPGAVV